MSIFPKEGDTYFCTADIEVKLLPLRLKTIGCLAAASSFISAIRETRNILPEPFDYFNHANNVSLSAATGVYVASTIAKLFSKEETPPTRSQVRAWVIGSAFATALIMNAWWETKSGVAFMRVENWTTPDPIDLAYGVVAGTAAGAAVIGISDIAAQPRPHAEQA